MDPIETAKLLIAKRYNEALGAPTRNGGLMIYTHDVIVVWFCYILGGWKALLIVNHETGYEGAKYYEVTHNVNADETYIDTYMKISNVKVESEGPVETDTDSVTVNYSTHPGLEGADPSDFISIGPECFSDGAGNIISWKGENFYRACGHPVVHNIDGSASSCVRRVGHYPIDHEDYNGIVVKGRAASN